MVLFKTIRQFLIRLHVYLSYDSAIMVMHIYPKNNKTNVCKNICIRIFVAASYKVAQN